MASVNQEHAINDAARIKPGHEPRFDVKSHVAQTLIEAMEKGETPWQRPWSVNSMKPINATTSNGYKGINRQLLALATRSNSSGIGPYADNRWMTYQQALDKGWQVKGGEKGTMIVKVVEFDRAKEERGAKEGKGANSGGGEQSAERRKSMALRHYFVFNAEQVDGVPPMEQATDLAFDSVKKAEAVLTALKEKTGLLILHGGNKAFYSPKLDEIRIPHQKKFATIYDYYATAMHEAAHSTLHASRLNRTEALGQRWGDEAYAVEELRAEIASAILASETGVPMSQDPKHLENHAAYLRSWIKAIKNDPMAIFSAAKDADLMANYMLELERERTALTPHKEWLAEHENAKEIATVR
ncbi:MAG: zincin-like metallopeptidase domain-containing protein [Pseudomonadota bacterium]